MRCILYILIFIPSLIWSQELTAVDYATAFDDVPAYHLNKNYPKIKNDQ